MSFLPILLLSLLLAGAAILAFAARPRPSAVGAPIASLDRSPLLPAVVQSGFWATYWAGVLFRQRVERLMLYTGIALLPGFILALVEGQPEAVILGAASVLMGVFSAPVFLRALIAWKTPGMITQTEDTVSVCFLVAMLLGGGSRLSLFGLQVGMVGAAFLTVGAGFYLGSGAGTLMGMLGGISMAAQGYPMDLAVALGAGGFLAGLTRRRESAPLSAFAFAVGEPVARKEWEDLGLSAGGDED